MKIHTSKKAMCMRVVLLVVGIIILSAKDCDMKPVGPGGDGDKPVTLAYICPNGTVTAGTAPAENTEKCSACNTGFELSANTCVALPDTIAYICTNGIIAAGIAEAENTEKCSACDSGFTLNAANECVALVRRDFATSVVVSHGKTLANGDQFGSALANAGDLDGGGGTVLAVGAQADNTGGSGRGAIYLLSYNAAGVLQTTKKIAHGLDETNVADTLAPSLANGDGFGTSIANAGDLYGNNTTVLAVGAAGDDTGDTDKGAIYLLSFNASGNLTATTKIADGTAQLPSLDKSGLFGISIANAGDLDGGGGTVLAVGAQDEGQRSFRDGGINWGAIYLLSFNPAGALQNTKKIGNGVDETNTAHTLAPSLSTGDRFGRSITNAGDLDGGGGTVLAVGANGDNISRTSNGAIYLLSFSAAGALQNIKKITGNLDETNAGSNANAPIFSFDGALFGTSLANAGDLYATGGTVLAVGAAGYINGGGSVYILSFSATGALRAVTATHSDDNSPTVSQLYFFGTSLASVGNLAGNDDLVLAVGGIGNNSLPDVTNKTGELQLLYFRPPAED